MSGNFSETVGQGLETYSKYNSIMSLFFTLLIGCVCSCIAILFFRYRYKKEENMTVKSSQCTKVGDEYKCVVSVEFQLNNKTYSNSDIHMTASRDVQPGETVILLYDPNDPNDIIDGVKINYIGWFFLIPAMCIVCLSLIYTLFTFSSKGFAQVTGGISAGRQIIPRGSTTNVYSGYSPGHSSSYNSPFNANTSSSSSLAYLGKVFSQIIPKGKPRN